MTSRRWIAVLTAGSAGVLTVAISWPPEPAAALPGGRAHRGGVPRVQPSPSASSTPNDGINVTIGPEDDDRDRNRRFRRRPFRTRRHLEFTGAIGWPELAMGCWFDPDFEGADEDGRRVVCIDFAVRPPGNAPTRVRGRRFFFIHHRRFHDHRSN
ncbi:hypothetical protein AB0L00_40570 [Actinoallomurus sp. NPDC052308]|uniref:hypothetical protein n=1 Tax=Actinoallomurus sp. NPDC052308 TaxID=3155530 RepID=UPI00342F7BF2